MRQGAGRGAVCASFLLGGLLRIQASAADSSHTPLTTRVHNEPSNLFRGGRRGGPCSLLLPPPPPLCSFTLVHYLPPPSFTRLFFFIIIFSLSIFSSSLPHPFFPPTFLPHRGRHSSYFVPPVPVGPQRLGRPDSVRRGGQPIHLPAAGLPKGKEEMEEERRRGGAERKREEQRSSFITMAINNANSAAAAAGGG